MNIVFKRAAYWRETQDIKWIVNKNTSHRKYLMVFILFRVMTTTD